MSLLVEKPVPSEYPPAPRVRRNPCDVPPELPATPYGEDILPETIKFPVRYTFPEVLFVIIVLVYKFDPKKPLRDIKDPPVNVGPENPVVAPNTAPVNAPPENPDVAPNTAPVKDVPVNEGPEKPEVATYVAPVNDPPEKPVVAPNTAPVKDVPVNEGPEKPDVAM